MRQALKVILPILLLIAPLWGIQYARRGYWDPDEPRFVYVAREMMAEGSYFVPRRNGDIYAHKPPLMFWLIQAGEQIFPEPFGSRLPSMLGLFMTLLSLFKIGEMLSCAKTGWRAVLIVSTSWLFWSCMGTGQMDPLLTGLEMTALWLMFRSEKTGRFPWAAFPFMGLAILTKGPVGLVVPCGAYISSRIGRCQRDDSNDNALVPCKRYQLIMKISCGIAIAFAIPALWLGACALSGAPKEYFDEIVFSQTIGRITSAYDKADATPGVIRTSQENKVAAIPSVKPVNQQKRTDGRYGHKHSFFYFFIQAPLGFLPWVIPLLFAVRWRSNETCRRAGCWALFVILFFSIPTSKRGIYVMLAYPALALIVAAKWDDLVTCHRLSVLSRIGWTLLTSVTAVAAIVVCACPKTTLVETGIMGLEVFDGIGLSNIRLMCIPLAAISLISALEVMNAVPEFLKRDAMLRDAAALVAVFSIAGSFMMPLLNKVKTADEIKIAADAHISPTGRLLLYKMDGENAALHSGRMGMRLENDEEMRSAMLSQHHGIAIFGQKNAQNLDTRFHGISIQANNFVIGKKRMVLAIFDEKKDLEN